MSTPAGSKAEFVIVDALTNRRLCLGGPVFFSVKKAFCFGTTATGWLGRK
jgi:hypothetical protein